MSAEGRVCNFSAGPAALPLEVLQTAQAEMLNWHGTGMSVMEMSHRSKPYESIIHQAEADLRTLLNIPPNFKVLFLQGGALGAFAAVPLNLLKGTSGVVDYVITGHWGKNAANEVKKYAKEVHVVCSGEAGKFTDIPDHSTWNFSPNAAYIHYTSNETIHGVEFPEACPEFPAGSVVVCDMSSDFLSRPIPDWSKYGVVYAGAQKNAGPAGTCIYIVRDDLLTRTLDICPSVWSWKEQSKPDAVSMLNTPPCYTIYICGLYFSYLLKNGGVAGAAERNAAKAERLYTAIESSNGYYTCPVAPRCRSKMNIPFRILGGCEALENEFVKQAEKAGLTQLKGHRSVGGLRASIYNACTFENVEKLVQFMHDFQAKHPTAPAPAEK